MLDKAAAKSAAALFVCKNYGVIEKGRISGREMRKWHISLSNLPDGGLLQGERIYILNTDFMSLRDAIVTFEFYSSCGFHVLDHLAADGAGFTGGQVTVVTVGQVDADLGSGLHLELVHCLTGLGDVDLVVALHIHSLLLSFSRKARRLSGENAFFLSATIALPNQRKI